MLPARVLGLEVIRTSGKEEVVKCPFHTDTNPSAWWNPEKGLFWCAVCMKGMNAYMLAKALGVPLEVIEKGLLAEPEDYDLFSETLRLPRGERVYANYIKDRGISERIAIAYGVEWREDKPQAAVLPIPDINAEVVAVVHRYVNPKETGTRYKFFGEPTPVWPINMLRHVGTKRPIIVTEGAWSAMRIATFCVESRSDFYNCFALFGAKANQRIVEVLAPFKPVYLYDNDKAGRKACEKMRSIMSADSLAFTLNTSPDDMDNGEVEKLFESLRKRTQ